MLFPNWPRLPARLFGKLCFSSRVSLTLLSSLNHLNHQLGPEPLTQDGETPSSPFAPFLPGVVFMEGEEERGECCSTEKPVVLCPRAQKSHILPAPDVPQWPCLLWALLAFLRGALPCNCPPAWAFFLSHPRPSSLTLCYNSKDRPVWQPEGTVLGSLNSSFPWIGR